MYAGRGTSHLGSYAVACAANRNVMSRTGLVGRASRGSEDRLSRLAYNIPSVCMVQERVVSFHHGAGSGSSSGRLQWWRCRSSRLQNGRHHGCCCRRSTWPHRKQRPGAKVCVFCTVASVSSAFCSKQRHPESTVQCRHLTAFSILHCQSHSHRLNACSQMSSIICRLDIHA